MIQENLSQKKALGKIEPFTKYDIELIDFSGQACGRVLYVRIGKPINDVLNNAIYEAIKTRYPGSHKTEQVYDTTIALNSFVQFNNYDRMYISARNNTNYDPARILGNVNSEISIHLDVYDPADTYVFNELEVYLNENQNDIANACNEEYANLATYREFIQ